MARIGVLDVLKGKNPNTEAVQSKSSVKRKDELTKKYAEEGKRRRSEMSRTQESDAMLKKGKRSGNADPSVAQKATKGGTYPVYKKGTDTAQSFKSAFADARKAGKGTFSWNGKSYNTKVK